MKREGLPTVQNLSQVQRRSGEKRRSNELQERGSTMNEGKNPKEGCQEAGQEEEGGGSVTPLGKSHQGGGERGWWIPR